MIVSEKKMVKRYHIIHVSVSTGHHLSYLKVLSEILDAQPSIGKISGRIAIRLIRADKVFFGTIDSDYVGFIFVALLRAVLGRSTAGLFIRPLTCIREKKKLPQKLKYLFFSFVNKLEKVAAISIIPHYIDRKLEAISRDWIYDPQFWDWQLLQDSDATESSFIEKKILERSGGRDVLAFIGSADSHKAFDEFFSYAINNSARLFCVVAGKVSESYKEQAEILKSLGMVVEDRYVSDKEIEAIYRVSNLIWCCYNRNYDQSSGVFGRALQANVKPITREGSVIRIIYENLIKDGYFESGKFSAEKLLIRSCAILKKYFV